MKLGVIADDFTGAGDVANSIARVGLSTVLAFTECPGTVPADTQAVVVGIKSRSALVEIAVEQSLAVGKGLLDLGAEQILFKICSTFDSTPDGNIGPVTEALTKSLGYEGPVLICPAFPDARRTVYEGHLFVGDHLLSESGMERHPLNPMTDADLRRWLRPQSRSEVGHLPLAVVRQGQEAMERHLQNASGQLIIADAIEDRDLLALGCLAEKMPLVVGASGIAAGVAARHRNSAPGTPNVTSLSVAGPGLVIAGSCSRATIGQVASYRERHPALALDVPAIVDGRFTAAMAADFILNHLQQSPLVFSTGEAAENAALQERFGVARLAEALDRFFAELASLAVAGGVTRLVVAGGETSGAVVTALGIPMLQVGPEIATGVPALFALDRPLALALKSGNFGGPEFFAAALAALGSNTEGPEAGA